MLTAARWAKFLTLTLEELISLAKRIEEIFLPGQKLSFLLPKSSSALRLVIKLRDEAHRFAISYHRKKRKSRTLISELDRIKGIGSDLKFLLLKEFGSVERIRKANLTELTKIKGIGRQTAEKILKELNTREGD